jgi:hypothetical protein
MLEHTHIRSTRLYNDALCLKDKNTVRGALEYMQYNGRTIKTCIFMAMGYEDCVGKENT